ncbi:lysine-specific demethylase 3B [Platysternon megacephalum]|uniref:Lysine-specific demethylase 3B n=1 Tax=Platysternon megacephalum TaxID=55544 RepID=A0A4D9DVI0_9SAUR|nr:lysine-specific demethylase 3B [Platysternon megacephalum]
MGNRDRFSSSPRVGGLAAHGVVPILGSHLPLWDRCTAQAITPPRPSECEQCTCDPDGIARCLVADCAPPPCVNAVYETGQCCPTCQEGPNCYADRSRTRVIPAGAAVWVEPCTRCRCHNGQDTGYWEGNRVAKCERLRNCPPLDRHNS